MNQQICIIKKSNVSSFTFETIQEAIFLNLQKFGTKRVFYYSEDGKTFDEGITYEQLFSESLKAAQFLSMHTSPGDRILLLYSSGPEFLKIVMACIITGVIAVPCPPPRNLKNLEKLFILSKDCKPNFAIYGSSVSKFLEVSKIDITQLPFKIIRDSVLFDSPPLEKQRIHNATVKSPVLLQYTSGSTGKPKGVIINHENLISNVAMFNSSMNFTNETIKVSWLPVYHDMGFVGSIMSCILLAPTLYQSDPLSFAANPISWLTNISKFKATLTGGPNFAFEQINKRIGKLQNVELNLSSLQLMYCGAEPIKVDTLKQFSNNLKQYGFEEKCFYPCYGMAESTLIISGADRTNPLKTSPLPDKSTQNIKPRKIISVGHIFSNEDILIIHPETMELQNENEVGEILVSGPNVSVGYWDNLKETEKTFIKMQNKIFLRTGDLGFIKESELYITGRHKDLIIINGRNIYPSDLEFTLSDMKEIRPNGVAAVPYTDDKSEHAMFIIELNPDALKQNFDSLYENINKQIFENFDISIKYLYFVKPGGILKTTSGKVMRRETKKQLIENKALIVFESIAVDNLNLD